MNHVGSSLCVMKLMVMRNIGLGPILNNSYNDQDINKNNII